MSTLASKILDGLKNVHKRFYMVGGIVVCVALLTLIDLAQHETREKHNNNRAGLLDPEKRRLRAAYNNGKFGSVFLSVIMGILAGAMTAFRYPKFNRFENSKKYNRSKVGYGIFMIVLVYLLIHHITKYHVHEDYENKGFSFITVKTGSGSLSVTVFLILLIIFNIFMSLESLI